MREKSRVIEILVENSPGIPYFKICIAVKGAGFKILIQTGVLVHLRNILTVIR